MTRPSTLVWIDAREAVIVRWHDDGVRLARVESELPARRRATGHVRHDPAVRHGGGGSAQSAGEPHRLEHLERFVVEIANRLAADDDLLIIGPGTVHEGLDRHFLESDRHHGRDRDVACEASQPLTDRQLVARLRAFARAEPRRRTVGAYRWGELPARRPSGHAQLPLATRRRAAAARAGPRRAVTKEEKDMDSKAMRILVAIDGSEPAKLGVDLVADVAWPSATEILVAEAVETGAGLFGGPWPALAMVQTERIEAEIRDQAQRTVHEARGGLERPGLNVDAVVLRGRPATAIVERARAKRADLIVVGSLGHGTIESMLLGSVSAEVVDHAPMPVLVARGRRIEHVVLAWDGSPGASRAADLLCAWPIFAASTVRVVSVADVEIPWWTGFPEPSSPELVPVYLDAVNASRRQHDQLAREMTAQLQAAGLTAEADRRDGDAATEILAAASASKADLIVMGTRGRTGLSRLVLGSVARNVLHHASCSVLVVRGGSTGTSPKVA